jgi:hypothetical protein
MRLLILILLVYFGYRLLSDPLIWRSIFLIILIA